MKETMKAARLYSPGDLRVEEVEIPGIGPGEALVKVLVAGHCGSDLQRIMASGTYHFPTIPGHEFSGEVVETGSDVTEISIGDRVTVIPLIPCMRCSYCLTGEYNLCDDYDYLGSRSDGAYAQYVKAPVSNLLKLPEGVDFEDGAATDPAAVALHALRKAGGLDIEEDVVIFGAGPIGLFACQLARRLGASKVFVVDIVPEKLKLAIELGADLGIDAKSQDPVKVLLDETKGRGASLVLETSGAVACQRQALVVAKKLGKVVYIGRSYSDVLFSDFEFTRIFRNELLVTGGVNYSFSPLKSEWRAILGFMQKGDLKVKPIISHRFSLDEIAGVYQAMHKKEFIYNKVFFYPNGPVLA